MNTFDRSTVAFDFLMADIAFDGTTVAFDFLLIGVNVIIRVAKGE